MIQQEHMGHFASLSEKNKGQVSISSAPLKKPRKRRVKVNEVETERGKANGSTAKSGDPKAHKPLTTD